MMTERDKNKKEMEDAVRLRLRRHEEWQRTGERPLWHSLSMIGSIGWLIVIPMLIGAVLGRWLDEYFGASIFWSGALIMLGAVLGGYLAWQRVREE
ncbi:MAG: AtpZ/AtpI family protein [Filomicrobium sp.]|jgi:ATP synthase protein I